MARGIREKREKIMTTGRFLGIMLILTVAVFSGCGKKDDNGAPPVQPTRADVFIAFDQPVTNLAGLDLKLDNTAGATFDNTTQPITAINAAQGSLSLTVGNFDAATNSTRIILINGSAAGINTDTTPIVKITYAIADGAGSPTFSISSQATFSVIAPDNGPTTPPVTPANVVVTVTYQ
jgi:hypothetical protein